MIREIVKGPVPVLTTPAQPFLFGQHDPRELAVDLIDTMVAAPGIGLAANQIGVPLRAFAFVAFEGNQIVPDAKPKVVFNPEITATSGKMIKLEEGCLSFPELICEIERPEYIQVKYQDIMGNFHELTLSGMLGRIWQHEIEHLDGKLFYNNLSPVTRWFVMKKWRKNVNRKA